MDEAEKQRIKATVAKHSKQSKLRFRPKQPRQALASLSDNKGHAAVSKGAEKTGMCTLRSDTERIPANIHARKRFPHHDCVCACAYAGLKPHRGKECRFVCACV